LPWGKCGDFRRVGVLGGVVRRGIKLEEQRCACLCGQVRDVDSYRGNVLATVSMKKEIRLTRSLEIPPMLL